MASDDDVIIIRRRQRLMQLMVDEEGFRAEPYLDTKKLWTLGIGHCLERAYITPEAWKHLLDNKLIEVRITREGAEYLAQQRLELVELGVSRLFKNWDQLNETRQLVLLSMGYQMGTDGVAKFVKMRAAIERGDFVEAAKEGLDSKWAKVDSPARAKRHMLQLERGY